jgi:hypothetical protein
MLESGDVRSLQTFRSLGHVEFNRLAFVQRFVSLRLNRGEMDENVLAGLPLDESKTLTGVKPLYCSLFFQLCFSFLFELFGASSHRLQQKKRPRVWSRGSFTKSKGFSQSNKRTVMIARFCLPVQPILKTIQAPAN